MFAGRRFFARRAVILLAIIGLPGSSMMFAQQRSIARTGGGVSDAQKKAIQSIRDLADDAAAGRPTPNDLALTWVHHDLLKVQANGQAFVPFIVTIDPAKVMGNTVSVYWRVVSKAAAAAVPSPDYAYESITAATIVPGEPARISRSFTTVAGSYDVYVVVREGPPPAAADKKGEKNASVPKAAAIKQTVTVPDLWNGELNTSSVILAERINVLPAPLSNEEKVGRPYALGGAELVPYTRLKFLKKEELDAVILIYNVKADAAGKPDVTVEFNFYTKQGNAEKFFNRTLPTNLNGQTLPPQDLGAIQLQVGQAVPLRDFPEGDYRMEIKVTDNIVKKDVKRDVSFSVTGS